MPKQEQAQIRTVGVEELVALAWRRYLKNLERGKTSRRVSFPLPPTLLPPAKSKYDTAMGQIKVYANFNISEGRWWITVVLPPGTGFPIRDHVKPSDPSSSTDQNR